MTQQTNNIPKPILDMMLEMGVIEATPTPAHAPVKHPPKKVEMPFRRPNFDENGEPDF